MAERDPKEVAERRIQDSDSNFYGVLGERLAAAERHITGMPFPSPCSCGSWIHRLGCKGPFLTYGAGNG